MAYSNDPRRAPAMERRSPPRPYPPQGAPHSQPRRHRGARSREALHAEAGAYHAELVNQSYKDDRRRTGIRDIVGGLVLIGIGFAYGGSIFMGTADVIDWAFDLLGTFWLAKGIYMLVT